MTRPTRHSEAPSCEVFQTCSLNLHLINSSPHTLSTFLSVVCCLTAEYNLDRSFRQEGEPLSRLKTEDSTLRVAASLRGAAVSKQDAREVPDGA